MAHNKLDTRSSIIDHRRSTFNVFELPTKKSA